MRRLSPRWIERTFETKPLKSSGNRVLTLPDFLHKRLGPKGIFQSFLTLQLREDDSLLFHQLRDIRGDIADLVAFAVPV